MLQQRGIEPSRRLEVLDAGCGTDSAERWVAPYARSAGGVDLSDGMLAHAKDKTSNPHLIKAELSAYLRDHGEAFDLIVSADTLVYFARPQGT